MKKISMCTSNVNDRRAARKEYSIVLAAHDNYMVADSGTIFHLTLDPHKLCLFSVTV